jgi:hypothetical protein
MKYGTTRNIRKGYLKKFMKMEKLVEIREKDFCAASRSWQVLILK